MGLYQSGGKCLLTGCVALGIELIKCSLIHSVLPPSVAPRHRSIIIQMVGKCTRRRPTETLHLLWLRPKAARGFAWKFKMLFVLSVCAVISMEPWTVSAPREGFWSSLAAALLFAEPRWMLKVPWNGFYIVTCSLTVWCDVVWSRKLGRDFSLRFKKSETKLLDVWMHLEWFSMTATVVSLQRDNFQMVQGLHNCKLAVKQILKMQFTDSKQRMCVLYHDSQQSFAQSGYFWRLRILKNVIKALVWTLCCQCPQFY